MNTDVKIRVKSRVRFAG